LATIGFAHAASAAELDLEYLRASKGYEPPYEAIQSPGQDWTGYYIGVNAGGTWSGNSVDVTTVSTFINTAALTPLGQTSGPAAAAGATGSFPVNRTGFIGGGQYGYNYQISSSVVAGIEADIQGVAGATGSSGVTNVTPRTGFFPPNTMVTTVGVRQRLDYLGTVRGRLGFLVTPTLWAYATGGLAYGGVESSTSITTSENPITGSTTATGSGSAPTARLGWTAGGGVEWAFAPSWSAKAEYLYYDLGTATYGNGPLTSFLTGTTTVNFVDSSSSSTRFTGSIARVGINYQFNGGPVVASY
jgi:outer membrane immunogenic protein